MRFLFSFFVVLMVFAHSSAALAQGKPLLMEGKKSLYQRVLTRPTAKLAASPGASGASDIQPFSIMYVYTRKSVNAEEWVQVGRASIGPADGWVPAKDVIDWKQTMTVAFTNPSGREPVVFLRDHQSLQDLLAAHNPGDAAATLRAAATAANSNGSTPVVAIEPANFIDINHQFYLLPILSAEETMNDRGDTIRSLEVASITAKAPVVSAPNLDALRKYTAAVVFVVDTTKSMDPYIARTKEAIQRIYDRIRNTAVADKFRFGLVVFRNSTKATPALEYTAKIVQDIDPAEPPEAMLAKMDAVKAATVSSGSTFYEDPFAGLRLAIQDMKWDTYGGRYVILVSDAGGRAAGDPLSTTGLGPSEVRQLAHEKQIAVYAMHLLTPAGQADHDRAKAQYAELTQFAQAGSLYYGVPAGSVDQFGAIVDHIANDLLTRTSAAIGLPIGGVNPPAAPSPGLEQQLADQARIVGHAMELAYLGRQLGTQAPDVFRGWAADRDLRNPQNPSLEVRVLLTKNQLSDLQDALKLVLENGLAARISPDQFFHQLKAATLAVGRDPRGLNQLNKIGDIMGEYLDGLPYRSRVMTMTDEEWRQMGGVAQREFLNAIEAKLRLYQEFHDEPDLWVSFDGGRVPGDAMYPVPLEALP